MPEFDDAAFFDDDYLHFYAARLNDEATDEEAAFIASFLGLTPGMAVLDLACGHGRIANRLAGMGVSVTALDASTSYLARGRSDAERQNVQVEYVHGDMRDLPDEWRHRFDAVVCWFSSFGYFGDEDNRRCLGEIAKVTKAGGQVLFDLHNRDWLLRNYQADRALIVGDDVMLDRSFFDVENSRSVIERTVVRNGSVRRIPYFVRMSTPPELREWLRAAGFADVRFHGEAGSALTLDSRRLLTLARR